MKRNIIIISIIIFISALILFTRFKLINDNEKTENSNSNTEINSTETNNESNQNNIGDTNMDLKIIIGNKSYNVSLEDNDTTRKFINMMPLELDMKELNNNEKYYYLDSNLPTNEYNPQKINTGDIMLFGNNCLVIFYKSFNTSYSYTKLGSIDNPIGLEEALGSEDITVKFEAIFDD